MTEIQAIAGFYQQPPFVLWSRLPRYRSTIMTLIEVQNTHPYVKRFLNQVSIRFRNSDYATGLDGDIQTLRSVLGQSSKEAGSSPVNQEFRGVYPYKSWCAVEIELADLPDYTIDYQGKDRSFDEYISTHIGYMAAHLNRLIYDLNVFVPVLKLSNKSKFLLADLDPKVPSDSGLNYRVVKYLQKDFEVVSIKEITWAYQHLISITASHLYECLNRGLVDHFDFDIYAEPHNSELEMLGSIESYKSVLFGIGEERTSPELFAELSNVDRADVFEFLWGGMN